MSISGDAAEQMLRITLEGVEVALRLTGAAAKNIAILLYVILKNKDSAKTRGAQRLASMLKSGKELKVFTVSQKNLKTFAAQARRYGIVYCALRGRNNPPDGVVDVMVRAEDADKINRIVERFKLATVDVTTVQHETAQPSQEAPGQETAGKSEIDKASVETATQREGYDPNPSAAKAEKSPRSEPTSEPPRNTAEGITDPDRKPSVKQELRRLKKHRREQEGGAPAAKEQAGQDKAKSNQAAYKQPVQMKFEKQKVR